MRAFSFISLLAISSSVRASVIPESAVTDSSITSESAGSAGGCRNGPNSRTCWSRGFDISTDVEKKWPNTGKTVPYDLEITEKILSPDGVPKPMLVVNGQYPGPVLTANWGDVLKIKVKNSLTVNGTSIHWHGFRQLNSNSEDGADGVTECPIPPGETRTYKFLATQHGTSWYHSHFVSQYGDGIVGPIIINGPAAENYDEDLGALPITDHYYPSMYHVSTTSIRGLPPPPADNGLINGRNKNSAGTAGSYYTQSLIPGRRYRLRIINTSTVNGFKVQLDGHKFKVIQADFVPIVPYETDWLFVSIGQRYDVVFKASPTPDNYWFRAVAPGRCMLNKNNGGIRAIFNNGVQAKEPNTTATLFNDICDDEKTLVPYVTDSIPRETFNVSGDSNLTAVAKLESVLTWRLNGIPLRLEPGKPTLEYILNRDTSYRQKPSLQIYELPKVDSWHFLLVQDVMGFPHPLHLHGFDLRILGSSFGPGNFTSATVNALNFDNPPRRDTVTLPGFGWVALAFKTDNPGAWLFHCHIPWHTTEGMGIQFLVRPDEIRRTFSLDYLKPECKAWDKWYKTSPHPIDPVV